MLKPFDSAGPGFRFDYTGFLHCSVAAEGVVISSGEDDELLKLAQRPTGLLSSRVWFCEKEKCCDDDI